MLGSTFEISIRLFRQTTIYRMKVEVIYLSTQVIRFKISAGSKSFQLEKLLFRKNNQWKIIQGSFNFMRNKSSKEIEDAIQLITNQIDGWLKQQKGTNQ